MEIEVQSTIEITTTHITNFIKECDDPFALCSFIRASIRQLTLENIKDIREFLEDPITFEGQTSNRTLPERDKKFLEEVEKLIEILKGQ